MKAKYFKKIRSQVRYYKVSHRDCIACDFNNEKEVLAKSPENACIRYHKRTGAFINKRDIYNITQMPEQLSNFKVRIGQKVMYFD